MFLGTIVLAVALTPLCYLDEGTGRESCRNTSTATKTAGKGASKPAPAPAKETPLPPPPKPDRAAPK